MKIEHERTGWNNALAADATEQGERYDAASVVRQMEQLAKEGRKELELHVPVVILA